jgi:phosphatidylserine/phosphatidylglycerophosphate/cardiolipin synthase-like enzyme
VLDVQLPALLRALDRLRSAAARPEIALRVYLDTAAADDAPPPWSPTTREMAAHLRPGVVLRTREFDGACVRNHAKFLAIDHRFLLVTSANFSYSAEHGNVEFGVLADNPNLTEAVEHEMRQAEEVALRAGSRMSSG